MPLIVLVALALGALSGGSGGADSTTNPTAGVLPALQVSGPAHAAAEAGPCAKVLEALPVRLGRLDPRVVHTTPDTPYVVAWGDPAIVLACGVDRPRDLVPGSNVEDFAGGSTAGPYFDVQRAGSGNVYTTVDRAAYIAVTIPGAYQAATYLPTLSTAIAKALPAVCSTDPNTPDPARLCTRRK